MLTIKIPPTNVVEKARPRRHVWFNLDRSNSMSGALGVAKKAMLALINNSDFLADTDRLTIYAFDGDNQIICEFLEVAEFKKDSNNARKKFDQLKVGGGTYIGAGYEDFLKFDHVSKEELNQYQLINFTMTDGMCDARFVAQTKDYIMKVREKFPQMISYGIGFGRHYIAKEVTELNFNHEFPAPIHIQNKIEIEPKFAFLNFAINQHNSTKVRVSLNIDDEQIDLPNIKYVRAGDEYSLFFKFNKKK